MSAIAQSLGHSQTGKKMSTRTATSNHCVHKKFTILNSRSHSHLHGGALVVGRLKHTLPIDVEQQTDAE